MKIETGTLKNETETRTDNTVSYTSSSCWTVNTVNKKEPIYKCDLFGDEWSIVHFVYDEKLVPSWFRRQCQRFFLGTKWTKL